MPSRSCESQTHRPGPGRRERVVTRTPIHVAPDTPNTLAKVDGSTKERVWKARWGRVFQPSQNRHRIAERRLNKRIRKLESKGRLCRTFLAWLRNADGSRRLIFWRSVRAARGRSHRSQTGRWRCSSDAPGRGRASAARTTAAHSVPKDGGSRVPECWRLVLGCRSSPSRTKPKLSHRMSDAMLKWRPHRNSLIGL